MKHFLPILTLAWLATVATSSAAEGPITYYVQLIRCCYQEQAPQPGCKRIGPKLAERLQCVLRCTSFWEISQEKIQVLPNHTARVHLGNDREVEIDRTQPGKRRVTAFQKGRVLDRTIEPSGEHMTLIGGDRDPKSHWFIVVRRDKPAQ